MTLPYNRYTNRARNRKFFLILTHPVLFGKGGIKNTGQRHKELI